jgi:hypothetical protein
MGKRWLYIMLVFFYLPTLYAQEKNHRMERFDIAEFNAHQANGRYDRVLKDGTRVDQFSVASGYVENQTPSKGWFYTHREFYVDGQLKLQGDLFKKGGYKAGVWTEYDSTGRDVKATDYDTTYTLSLDTVFKIIERRGIHFSMEHKFDAIRRNVVDGKPVWLVEWQEKSGRVEVAYIDDASGKIIRNDFYLFKKN